MKYSEQKLGDLIKKYDFISIFLEENNFEEPDLTLSFNEFLHKYTDYEIEDKALDIDQTIDDFNIYVENMISFLGLDKAMIKSLTVLPGQDKSGNKEKFSELTIYPSQIISIVGMTGSGKSRLLQDIEWTADKDTPTKRTILINNKIPDKEWRFSSNNSLVAQLSQNMNFVMDLSVEEFLVLHAKSRLVEDIDVIVPKVIDEANKLAGEKFTKNSAITALSGGQSRALMIADTAFISASPIVLIDEIENAGIDKQKALNLLVSKEKIVLIATHDPVLALIADKRIVINNGGIIAVLETSDKEKMLLKKLKEQDLVHREMRKKLRFGERLGE